MFKEREIFLCDAVEWLNSSDEPFDGGVMTGIPDISDIPELARIGDVRQRSEAYITWFKAVVGNIFRRLPIGQYAIFSQTDAKIIDSNGCLISWVDKSHLCSSVAELNDCSLAWHKIALNTEISTDSKGMAPAYETQFRPAYTHLLCYGKGIVSPYRTCLFRTPDVIDRGAMTWQKATGMEACALGVAFLLNVARTPVLLNLFCGHGTILGVANYFHMRAVGLEILPTRAKQARQKDCSVYLDNMTDERLLQLGFTEENLIHSNRSVRARDRRSVGSDINADTNATDRLINDVHDLTVSASVMVAPSAPQSNIAEKFAMKRAIRARTKEQSTHTIHGVKSDLDQQLEQQSVESVIAAQQWTKCNYFLVRKQRLCAQKRAAGSLFCGHHQPEISADGPCIVTSPNDERMH